MAIYSSIPPPSSITPQPSSTASAPTGIDIESWTLSALESLSVSPSARGTGVTLSIPLDAGIDASGEELKKKKSGTNGYKRKEPVRRDSQRRRELLLKGKEGSRRRQRWENDHLLHVPNAQPPLPSDWAPHPTYPVHTVPYYLAPLWDAGIRHRAEELASSKKTAEAQRAGFSETKGRVPSELRMKLKRSKGAKTLLQDLEGEVRGFVREFELREKAALKRGPAGFGGSEADIDSEDEEIVFIGRDAHGNGITMSDEVKDVMEEELEREKKVYEGLVGTPEGGFARWLVHCVAGYYGLSSRSVTVGMRREAYVGIRIGEMREEGLGGGLGGEMPRPLWGLI